MVAPEQEKILQGLAREDLFTVVSEHFITDTARYADIVLPATTQMEQHEIMFSWGHFYLSFNQQAIAPRGEAVPNTELFRRLAKAMGYRRSVLPAQRRADGAGGDRLERAPRWKASPWSSSSATAMRGSRWARPIPTRRTPRAISPRPRARWS